MVKNFGKRLITILLAVMLVVSLLPLNVFATTQNVLDGQVSITDTANSNTVSNGTVTIKASGNLFTKKTNDITITNETANKAELSFDYSASTYNSFTIAGASVSASGSYSVLLDAGAKLAIKLVSNNGLSNTTATLTLSNFSLTVAADSSNVTVKYDDTLGSVTADGVAIDNGGVKQGVTLTDGVALVATAKSGATFHGWINSANNQIISTEKSYTLKPAADTTVKAVFTGAGSKPHFSIGAATQKSVSSGLLGLGKLYYHVVGKSYIYDDLNAAAAAAAADSSNNTLVLLNDSTLPAGTYTIPSGVTLLIPFDSQNSLYTTAVLNTFDKDSTTSSAYITPTAYRTLTMADGANLVINGSVSLSAKQRAAQGSKRNGGSPTGPVSFIRMQGNSNITVNNGGNLYAYGFITGSGSVTANSGGTVHEDFQFMDFRGGTQSTDMDNGVFPLSQYYIQNIEVPLTLYSGAKEYAYTTIYMSSADFGSAVAFIGSSGCMFNLTSGYVVKKYDGTKDRLLVEVNGDISLSSIKMSVGTSSIDSKEYELPINSNLTVDVKSGNIEVNQDIAFLPGSEMIIGKGVNCKINSGNNIYIYDSDEWGNYVFDSDTKYGGTGNGPFVPLTYAPGRTYDRTLNDLKDAMIQIDGTIDASAGYVYTTKGGANVFSTGTGVVKIQKGEQTVTHQLVQNTGYSEIPLTPAKLKNIDGSYITSATDTYNYDGSRWVCVNHDRTEEVVPPTCTAPGYTKQTCTVCGDIHIPEDSETPVVEHSYGDAVTTGPSCTAPEIITKTCTVCGFVETVAGDPATGHTMGEWIVDTEAGCETTGSQHKECANCDHTETEEIPAKGHEYSEKVTAPTCTDKGFTTYTCACGDSYVDNYVDALGHAMGDWIVDTEADCETAGSQHKECANCDHTETEEIPAKGHDYNAEVTAPTCTEQGYTTHTCSCGDSYVDNYVAALGHSWSAWETETESGCETSGSDKRTCSVCGEVETRDVDAKGHSYSSVVTEPTCTEQGYTTYTCSSCGNSYVEDYVAALGHAMGDWIVDKEAGCETAGSQHKECANCDYTETEEIPAKGHDYDTEVTAPTCTGKGFTTYTCACGDSYVDNYVDALGHNETAVVTKPTCTEQGYTTYTCGTCGNVRTDDYVDALGHDYKAEVTAPTCTEEGFTTYTCACGDSYVDNYVDALGHNEAAVVTEPTCTEQGYTTYTCGTCGEVRTDDYVDALGHDYKAEVTAPTCTEEGFTTYTCACGDSYVDNYVAALGHNHGEWEIKILATHSNEGMRVRKCACGDIETEVIPMIICDVDFDGFVNGSDLSVMKKYLINKITVTAEVEGLMDMNENGKVDILDLVKLKKYIAANTPVTK